MQRASVTWFSAYRAWNNMTRGYHSGIYEERAGGTRKVRSGAGCLSSSSERRLDSAHTDAQDNAAPHDSTW